MSGREIKLRIRERGLVLWAGLVFGVVLASVIWLWRTSADGLVAEIRVRDKDVFQVFYATDESGHGFSEEQSVRVVLDRLEGWQRIKVPMEHRQVTGIRLDPVASDREFYLRGVRWHRKGRWQSNALLETDAVERHGIVSMEAVDGEPGTWLMHPDPNLKDPVLVISGEVLSPPIPQLRRWISFGLVALGGAVSGLIVFRLLRGVLEPVFAVVWLGWLGFSSWVSGVYDRVHAAVDAWCIRWRLLNPVSCGVFALVGALVGWYQVPRHLESGLELRLRISTEAADYVHVYWDTGRGMNGRDAKLTWLSAEIMEDWIHVAIPVEQVNRIRIDLAGKPGKGWIGPVQMRRPGGAWHTLSMDDFEKVKHFEVLSGSGDRVEFNVPAEGPVIITSAIPDLPVRKFTVPSPWAAACFGFLVTFIGCALYNRLLTESMSIERVLELQNRNHA